MSEAVAQLKIAGQTYRVVTSANGDDLLRLAGRVEEALRSVTPNGRQPSEQAMVLAAITLAHELEQERSAREQAQARYEASLRGMLAKVEALLGAATPTQHEEPMASAGDGEFEFSFASGLAEHQEPARAVAYVRPRERGAAGSEG